MLRAIGVSDVKMEEGSLRVDANVSVRPVGSDDLGTKVEVKNMNSLRSSGGPSTSRSSDRPSQLDAGERIVQETRHWDEADGATHGMRIKEGAATTATSPSPTSCPSRRAPSSGTGSGRRCPSCRRPGGRGWWPTGGSPTPTPRVLVNVDGLADYAEAAIAALTAGTPRDVAHWCTGDGAGVPPRDRDRARRSSRGRPSASPSSVDLVADGTVSRNQAQDVLDQGLRDATRPREIVSERGLAQVSDETELTRVVEQVLVDNADVVAEWRAGDAAERKKKVVS